MVSQVTLLPDPPARTTQTPEVFVIRTDAWLAALQTFTVQVNELAVELDGLTVDAENYSLAAQDAATRAENAAAFRTSFAVGTLANLNALPGQYSGQSGAVFNDSNSANNGIYGWNGSAWTWLSSGLSATVDWDTGITGKPSTFPPSAHTQAISTITGLQTALDGKVTTGASATGGALVTTGPIILGRYSSGSGSLQSITVGSGLDLSAAGVLSYTGGSSMVYPATGIAVSAGSSWASSLAVPTGGLVGVTASQELTNKTLGSGTVISTGFDAGLTKTGGTIQGGARVNTTGSLATNSLGPRGLPPRSGGANPTVALTDMGECVTFTTSCTIPSGLPVGFACTIVNTATASRTITQGSGVSLTINGQVTTGNKTIAARGMAMIYVFANNNVIISGPVS